jgi:branched-chain amino acid transport system ATP-binding protein
MGKPLLELNMVSKRFGGLAALSDIQLEAHEGEMIGVIGPNGAGKSTLFGVISGFARPDKWQITFAGQTVTRMRPEERCRRGIVRTFQIVRPFPNLSVHDNVMLGILWQEGSVAKASSAAWSVLERMNMLEIASVQAGELTLPSRKRLEMARAVAARPRVLLLDEVAAGLNPTEVQEMTARIRDIRDSGVTVLWVEHVMSAVMNSAERIVVLNHGRLLADGSPQAVARNPEVLEAYLGQDYDGA